MKTIDALIEKVVTEILDGRKDYYHEIIDAITKAIPIIAEEIFEEIKKHERYIPSESSAFCGSEGYWLSESELQTLESHYQGEQRDEKN